MWVFGVYGVGVGFGGLRGGCGLLGFRVLWLWAV